MMTMPPAPDEPGRPGGGTDRPDAPRAGIAALWALVLDRFRDYLHWITIVADDPILRPGGEHDKDT